MKEQLRALLENGRHGEIAQLAKRNRGVLGRLIPFTFDSDPEIVQQAVEAMGITAAAVAESDPEHVRNHLRRLHWLLSEESGGVCWRAPEAMAEIVRRRPDLFADYIPIVVSLIDTMEEEDQAGFRTAILRAIGRLASCGGKEIREVLPRVAACLDDPDPRVRDMAAWCLRECGAPAARDRQA